MSDLSNATSPVTSSGGLPTGGYGDHQQQQQQPDQQGVAVGESGGQVPVDLRVGGQQPPTQQRAPVNGHLSGLQHSTESKHYLHCIILFLRFTGFKNFFDSKTDLKLTPHFLHSCFYFKIDVLWGLLKNVNQGAHKYTS